jgi:hypothetical protein
MFEKIGPVAQIQNKVSCRGETCFALSFRAIRKGRARSAPTKAEIFGNEIVLATGPIVFDFPHGVVILHAMIY